MRPTAALETVVRTDADLLALWERLMGAGGFATRSVWLLFLSTGGRPEPVIVPIDDLPDLPDERFVHALGDIISGLTESGDVASVAMLLSRPGPGAMTDSDRCWARALVPLASRWPVHLATTDVVRCFAPDDLLPCDVA